MDTLPAIQTDEEKELLDLWTNYAHYPKLSRWLDLYFDKKNQYGFNTYQDGTESAFIAYNIPRENEQYAWEIASKNASKCKVWCQRYYSIKGITKEKVLDLIAAHAVNGKPKAMEMLATIMEVYEAKPSIAINTQINMNKTVQITPEEEEKLNREFAEFIDYKYGVKSNLDNGLNQTSG